MNGPLVVLAYRNFLRNQRRTLITAASVAFSVWLAVIFLGTRKSTYERLVDAGTRAGYGDFTAANPDYFAMQTSHARLDALQWKNYFEAMPGVRAVLPRIMAQAVVASANKSTGSAVIGIDPASESSGTSLMLASHLSGQILSPGDDSGCYAGAELVEHLGVPIGGKIVYTTTAENGEMVSQVAYLRGTFRTGSAELDGHALLLPIDRLRGTLGYSSHDATLLALFVEKDSVSPKFPRSAAIEVRGWRETLPDLANFVRIDDVMHRILLLFIAIIVATGILNTMMLSVVERRRELGIMLALGMTPFQLVYLISLEAGMIALFGLICGAIISAPLYLYLHWHGLDLSAFIGQKIDAGGVSIDLVVGCQLGFSEVRAIGIVMLILTLLAAALPAVRAARTDPMRTIREA